MKSWRFTGTNEPLQLTDLPEPTAGPGQVVVDVKAAGICHTDVGILTDPGWMTMLAQVPVTLGHEDAGVISQVGEGVDDFRVGDRVAICPTTPAGCPGSSFDGGFGPKIVVGTQTLVRIPDEVCVCSIESGPCERVDVFHVSGRFWSTSACGEKRTPARPAWTSFPS